MNIEKRISNLPAKPEDLAKWLLVGKAKLAAQMKALKGINQLTDDVAAVQAALEDTQDLAEILLYAEAGLGRRLEAIPANYKELPSSVGRKPQLPPGITHKQSHYAQELSRHEEVIAEVVARAREQGEVPVRQQVLKEIQKAKPKLKPILPEGKYSIIYADPPWQYHVGDQHSNEEQETVLGTHYPSMSIEELCDMEIPAADNAALFMWATSPLTMSQEAFQVVNAWGFEAKACYVWDKVKHNVGHYNSVRHEFLLICIKGTMPHIDKLYDSVESIERTKHSEKPEYFRQIIDKMYPEGKRIELFARKKVEGWDCYGNDPVLQG